MFVVTDRAQLLAISRGSGRIRWISQLQRYRGGGDNAASGPVFWRGPVLAGGRLMLLSSMGHVSFINPADGRLMQTINANTSFSLPPVVADGTMYALDDMGMLSAWR